MPFEITQSGPDIKDGTYPAVLESVKEDSGQYGKFRKWTWLIEHENKIEPLTCYTSALTSTGSKSYRWLTGLLGKEPQVGERYEDPTGTRVLVSVIRNKNNFPTVDEVTPFTEPQQVMPGVPR